MRTFTPWIVSLVSFWIVGCGLTANRAVSMPNNPPRQVRVAVLPALWITPNPSVQADVANAALDGLRESSGVAAEDASASMESPTSESGAPCQEDLPCVRHVGTQLKAKKVVVVKLAELGDTVLARVMMVDVEGGTQEQTRQQVLRAPTTQAIMKEVRNMARELGRPFDPVTTPAPAPHPSWYERWWVWAGVGAAAGIAATTVVLLRPNNDPSPQPSSTAPPDIVIVPP